MPPALKHVMLSDQTVAAVVQKCAVFELTKLNWLLFIERVFEYGVINNFVTLSSFLKINNCCS